MQKFILIAITGLILFFSADLWACINPKDGYKWDKDRLIEESNTIALVKLVERKEIWDEDEEEKYLIYYENYLEPVEIIKGSVNKPLLFVTGYSEYSGIDFNNHRDADFWMEGVGRSEWPCCICGPDHTFVEGETYLYFPDALGAIKSAELIKSKDDEWYQYVKAQVAALQTDSAQVETVQKKSAQVEVLQTDPSCSERQN